MDDLSITHDVAELKKDGYDFTVGIDPDTPLELWIYNFTTTYISLDENNNWTLPFLEKDGETVAMSYIQHFITEVMAELNRFNEKRTIAMKKHIGKYEE